MTHLIEERITRKSLLYKTKVEYGDFTINHIQGCSHGCTYPCYAFLMAKRFGTVSDLEDWKRPKLVRNWQELLSREIPKYKERIKEVHLCFTSDPFMYGYPEIGETSMAILKLLNDHGIKCTALTKGILPLELKSLSPENAYGITLVSLDEQFRNTYEPGTAPYPQRIDALRKLSESGCKTWVSMEPFPTPNLVDQDVTALLEAVRFADKIIFGRLNYNKDVSAWKDQRSFYNKAAQRGMAFCQEHGIECHIKEGTLTT